MIRHTILATLVALNLSSVAVQASYGTDILIVKKAPYLGSVSLTPWYSQKPAVPYWEPWDTSHGVMETIGRMSEREYYNPTAKELKGIAVKKLIEQFSLRDQLQPKTPKRSTVSNKEVTLAFIFLACISAMAAAASEWGIRRENKAERERTKH